MFKYLWNYLFHSNITKELGSGQFNFLLNDPSTPDLSQPMNVPVYNQAPMISVANMSQQRSKQVFTSLVNAITYSQKILEKDITSWAAIRTLPAYPESGKQFNAFYDRRSLRFFYDVNPVTKKTIYTADSVDIVAHECGHALLDALRPDFWNMQAMEIWSFHEAFGDIIAMLTVMQFDKIIDKALKETNGDLRKSNVISRLAEDMGHAIYDYVGGGKGMRIDCLRDANNNFTYTEPEKLPESTPDNQLANECHSFGRLFVGVWYDIFVEIYKLNCATMSPKNAVIHARDVSAYLLLNGVRQAPANPRFYDSMAKTMLFVDKANGGKHQALLTNVFNKRKILKKSVKALSSLNFSDVILDKSHRVLSSENNKIMSVVKSEFKTIKLSDHFGIRSQSDNPLYNVEIEVPSENYMEFDENGVLVQEISANEKKIIESARACIKFLHEKKLVGDFTPENKTQFSVVEGKLIRNYTI